MKKSILTKVPERKYLSAMLEKTLTFHKLHKIISPLLMTLALFILFGIFGRIASYGATTTANTTQTSSTTTTSASISIAFDLPTAAVATFVLVLLGLAAALLLMARVSFADNSVME
jgi:hypothetical protein